MSLTIFLFAVMVGAGEMVPQVMANPDGKDHCVCQDITYYVYGAGVVVTGGIFLLPYMVPWFGFGAAGPGAGTIAAAVQSLLYGAAVPAGSLFATLQSIGMTGFTKAIVAAGLTSGAMTLTFDGIRPWLCACPENS